MYSLLIIFAHKLIISILQVSLKNLSRKAFLQVDEKSGFNLLQAAVFEEKYNLVVEASGLFDNFVEEMELTKTGKNAKEFIGKTAVDFLSLRKRTNPFHVDIERIYDKLAEHNSRLTELQFGAPSVAKYLFDDMKRNVTKFMKCNEIQRNEIWRAICSKIPFR